MSPELLTESVQIERLTRSGWGVARLTNGRYVHIPGVSVGERHLVQAFKTSKGWRGRSAHCEEASPNRITPDCDYYGSCAGCTHRHLSEADRKRTLLDGLTRFVTSQGHQPNLITWLGGVPAQGYRTRAVCLPHRDAHGGWSLRFSTTPTYGGVAIENCVNQVPEMSELATAVSAALGPDDEPFYPEERVGSIRHMILSTGYMDDETGYRVIMATHGPANQSRANTFATRLQSFLPTAQVYVDELPKRNAGLYSKPKPLGVELPMVQRIGSATFQVSPRSWWSQSPLSIETLVATVDRMVKIRTRDRVLEIGCGVGTLAVLLQPKCASWLGIDAERAAIIDATENTKTLSDLFRFCVGDGEHWLRKLVGRESFDVVIIHAMRLPFGVQFIRLLEMLNARVIVYIAPNPRSMLQDLDELEHYGVDEIGLLDQMPGSGHHLTVAQMTKVLSPQG